jgi:hypothetical protein
MPLPIHGQEKRQSPCMTCNHRRATDAATDEYTGQNREGRRHGKKRPDDRRTRNWARAMENRPKPPTSDPLAHGRVHGPVHGCLGTREKNGPTAVGHGTGRAPWKTGQNHRRVTHSHRDEYTDPYTGASGTREKTARRPSDTELGARHGKQAKTTDE